MIPNQSTSKLRGAARLLAGALLACAALLSTGSRDVSATPAPDPGAAARQGTPGGESLRAGVARTPAEILRCREEESARARQRRPPRIAAPGEPVRLRSAPVDLPQHGCEEAARRWNFYTRGNEANGCFVNAYVNRGIDKMVVPDLATGLMWEVFASKKVTFEGAQQYLRKLNDKKWAGFSDWRLPTTEEFQSILEAFEFDTYSRHLDTTFFVTGLEWWTSDRDAADESHWVVDALLASCRTLAPRYEALVRAVRTMSREELEGARKDFVKGG